MRAGTATYQPDEAAIAYSTTGLTGIPAAFIVVAVILALFATGYMAMSRHITNAGAFYAFIARSLGRIPGTAAAGHRAGGGRRASRTAGARSGPC